MTHPAPAPTPGTDHQCGLAYWMARVLKECRRASAHFDPDPVHDLRVALRRGRSLADGIMTVDPDPAWRAMRRAGRRLFRRLGRLRDLQVLVGWIDKLAPADDVVRTTLLPQLAQQENQLKQQARAALEKFDQAKWRKWAQSLPRRAKAVPLDGPVYQHLALERWQEAYELHRRAMRTRSRTAFHRLRIGLKRFRYTVENFLPSHADWLSDLKQLQDVLGEVHDLDVLWLSYFARRKLFDPETSLAWRARIDEERHKRLAEYRSRMTGANSLWKLWRAGLPDGCQLEEAALAKLRTWAGFLDPQFRHSEEVAWLALQLYDGLRKARPGTTRWDGGGRRILQAAALLHDVGRTKGSKGHHKVTYRLVSEFPPPLGWTEADLQLTAVVARYHRGAEPQMRHRGYAQLRLGTRRRVAWLAGVLRLADGLARSSPRRISQIEIADSPAALLIHASGYQDTQEAAALIGGRKHLLESVLGKAIVVRPWQAVHAHKPVSRKRRAKAKQSPADAAPSL